LRGMPEVKVFDCLDENLQEQVERHIEESLAA
jgi:hypothetical protein